MVPAMAEPVDVGTTEAPGTQTQTLPALKIALYELVLRQLLDDGFAASAHALTQETRLLPNGKVENDALLEVYSQSLKWAFGDEPQGEWVPIQCDPIPPVSA